MKQFLASLLEGKPLDAVETEALFDALLADGEQAPTDAQIGAVLFALGRRLPVVDELVGAVRSMRRHMRQVATPQGSVVVDTCGTGGSGKDAFNTSTVAGIVCAAAGLTVAKHGNRAMTSRCGSADLLEALGMQLSAEPDELQKMLQEVNFTFLFAPLFHPSTKRVQGVRRELGFRTIFNLLGPLVNPASPQVQLLGVSSPALVPLVGEALFHLGTQASLVVCGSDGLDELTVTGPSRAMLVKDGRLQEMVITPEDAGLPRAAPEAIVGADPQRSAERVRMVVSGEQSPYADLVMLNAGAVMWLCGRATTLRGGVELVHQLLTSGDVASHLERILARARAVRA